PALALESRSPTCRALSAVPGRRVAGTEPASECRVLLNLRRRLTVGRLISLRIGDRVLDRWRQAVMPVTVTAASSILVGSTLQRRAIAMTSDSDGVVAHQAVHSRRTRFALPG